LQQHLSVPSASSSSSSGRHRQSALADDDIPTTVVAFDSLPKLTSSSGSSSSSRPTPAVPSLDPGGTDARFGGGAAYVQAQAHAAKDLEAAQEEVLESMSASISRLAGISQAIHTELAVQNEALAELDDSMDTTASRFEQIDKRFQKMLKRSGWSHYKIIFCLLLLVFVLLLLVLFF